MGQTHGTQHKIIAVFDPSHHLSAPGLEVIVSLSQSSPCWETPRLFWVRASGSFWIRLNSNEKAARPLGGHMGTTNYYRIKCKYLVCFVFASDIPPIKFSKIPKSKVVTLFYFRLHLPQLSIIKQKKQGQSAKLMRKMSSWNPTRKRFPEFGQSPVSTKS